MKKKSCRRTVPSWFPTKKWRNGTVLFFPIAIHGIVLEKNEQILTPFCWWTCAIYRADELFHKQARLQVQQQNLGCVGCRNCPQAQRGRAGVRGNRATGCVGSTPRGGRRVFISLFWLIRGRSERRANGLKKRWELTGRRQNWESCSNKFARAAPALASLWHDCVFLVTSYTSFLLPSYPMCSRLSFFFFYGTRKGAGGTRTCSCCEVCFSRRHIISRKNIDPITNADSICYF